MIIQFILILLILIFVFRLFLKFKNRETDKKDFFLWLLIWILAIAVIAYPQGTVLIANKVGIGRGSDLIVYVSIIAIFFLLFRLLLRIEKMEKQITKIVRKDALKGKGDE